ncbi:hypothetical protein D7B24_007125 [Verticillium nonalfalfae]|uniref:Uncharacterized protein n=1 Tax=Verticillium nonalfalfae TaxID=1051616 RepID=A0A3M9YBS9_9PEZI|nr:uncharacterized protein D7B24_007125 [Verticillium nonalfalfae]RNJ56520.1 hypothetical protein D7B24_007125 [Verticillium nonalfalfae]
MGLRCDVPGADLRPRRLRGASVQPTRVRAWMKNRRSEKGARCPSDTEFEGRATTVPVVDVPDADEAQVDDDMAHGSSALVGMIRMQIGLGVACRQQFAESVAFAAAAQGSRRRDAPQRTFATATTTTMGGRYPISRCLLLLHAQDPW